MCQKLSLNFPAISRKNFNLMFQICSVNFLGKELVLATQLFIQIENKVISTKNKNDL